MKSIFVEPVNHKGKRRLKLKFQFDKDLIENIRRLEDCRWSQSMNCWHIPFRENGINFLQQAFGGNIRFYSRSNSGGIDSAKDFSLQPEIEQNLNKFRDYMENRRYSQSTVLTYINCLHQFFSFFHYKTITGITHEDVIVFNTRFILKNRYSPTYQNHVISALKLFYEK
ncbi:MAG: phage integrase N-terminal SAM-like domain-containing protein [Bacteroidales bacterium]|nr:phage integrase N-terminal SAM-like domain-containing protein [Bacteroidales bacterium]